VFLLFLAAVWLRWRRATPAERRDLAPLWLAVCIYVLVGLMGAFASPDTTGQPFAYLVWELQSVLQIGLPVVFVWGLLSARLARSAVGDLVMELDRPLPPGELRACLARTLGDPSLEVLYAREGHDGWVDAGGQPGSLPEPAGGPRARTVTVVERDGQPLAALIHDPALDQGLVRAAAAAAGMAIENDGCRPRCGPSWRRSGRPVSGSWQPPTPNGGGSSGTSMTGRSNAWQRSPLSWQCSGTGRPVTRPWQPRSTRPPPS
jgi:hypothetical protein